MAAPQTVLVDDLIDRQSLTGRNYFILGLLLIALLCDGFDLQIVAYAAPRLAKQWNLAPSSFLQYVQSREPAGNDAGRDLPRQSR